MPLPVSFRAVTPFLIGLVLIMPVVLIPVLMAVPDKDLTMRVTPEMIVLCPVLIEMKIGLRLIHHDLVTMVQIEIVIAGRQLTRKAPVPAI